MSTTLTEFYRNTGRSLPTLYERSVLYENLGLGSRDSYSGTVEQNTALLNAIQGKGEKPMGSYRIVTTDEIAATGFRIKQPLRDVNAFSINQAFGQNGAPFYRQIGLRGHNGEDLKAATGTPTLAVCPGEVIFAGSDGDGGISVEYLTRSIDVGGQEVRLRFVHYHLQKVLVKVGDMVIAGQEIGLTDNTGRYTTGPHLHFGCKIIYKVPDNEGGWVSDFNNGYRGAVNPEPLFDSFDYQLFPVDTRYGLPMNPIAEAYIKGVYLFMRRKLGHAPTKREQYAIGYGKWDIETVANVALFEIWGSRVKQ